MKPKKLALAVFAILSWSGYFVLIYLSAFEKSSLSRGTALGMAFILFITGVVSVGYLTIPAKDERQ